MIDSAVQRIEYAKSHLVHAADIIANPIKWEPEVAAFFGEAAWPETQEEREHRAIAVAIEGIIGFGLGEMVVAEIARRKSDWACSG